MRSDGTREILIFGAGNIGRSFIGQIFARSGFIPVFADVDRELVTALSRDGTYTVVHRNPAGGEERLEIGPVQAVIADDAEQRDPVLRRASLVATSVGAAVLPRILPILTAEAVRRVSNGLPPFDLILAENIHGAGAMVRDAMEAAFAAHIGEGSRGSADPPGYRNGRPFGGAPGVIECSVGKMVPLIPAELRTRDLTTVYAESFNELLVDADGWVGAPPAVPNIRLVSPIGAWVDRKLYIHNFGHAATAYLGFQSHPDKRFIWEVLEDAAVYQEVRSAMTASGDALQRAYPGVFQREDVDDHIEDLLYRFAGKGLGDTVFRVGRDLYRKLGPADRVVGTLRLLQRTGFNTQPIETVYRSALGFRGTDETGELFPTDREFHRELEAVRSSAHLFGIFLGRISGFDPTEDAELIERLRSS